jgi:hypothetical protein
MTTRFYALKNHHIYCEIDVYPFSERALDKLCEREGFDGWIVLDEKGFCVIGGFRLI